MASTRLWQQLKRLPNLESLDHSDLNLLTFETRAAVYTALLRKLVPDVTPPQWTGRRDSAKAFCVAVFSALADRAPAAPIKTYGMLLSDTKRDENYTLMAHLIELIHSATAAGARGRSKARVGSAGARKRSGAASAPVGGTTTTTAASAVHHPPWVGLTDTPPEPPPHTASADVAPATAAAHPPRRSKPKAPASLGESALPPDNTKFDQLMSEHTQLRETYAILVGDQGKETLDGRRLHLLKAQNVQLERQVLLYAQALDARADGIQAVENVVGLIASEVVSATHGIGVRTSSSSSSSSSSRAKPSAESQQHRRLADTMVRVGDLALDAEQKLEAATELRDGVLATKVPLFLASRFTGGRDAMVVDVCSGSSSRRVPPEQIDRLERELSALHIEVVELRAALGVVAPAAAAVLGPLATRLDRAAKRCDERIFRVAGDLQGLLAVLPTGPSAHRSPQRDPSGYAAALPTVDDVLGALFGAGPGPGSRQTKKESRSVVKDLVGRAHTVVGLADVAEDKLRAELAMHWRLHEVHTQYSAALHSELRAAEAAQAAAEAPLLALVSAFDSMLESRTEAALGDFVAAGDGVRAVVAGLTEVGATSVGADELQHRFVQQLDSAERESDTSRGVPYPL